ncbi:hypothetical protein DITRI_Ditri13aG0017200 [Diplodiscus trichospermus]
MGGEARHDDLPKTQSNSSSSVVPHVSSSSSSSSCQSEISKKIEAIDAKQNERVTGSFNDFVFGSVPSKSEVENAVSALLNFIHESSLLLSQGLKVYNSFVLLLTDPSVKMLVISLSCDKAFWDAVTNNELVRKLIDLPRPAVENGRPRNSKAEAELSNDILQWILDMAKAKIAELLLKFQSLLNQVFMGEKPDEQNRDQLEEKIRSSLLLSIVTLLIVIVARVQRALIGF